MAKKGSLAKLKKEQPPKMKHYEVVVLDKKRRVYGIEWLGGLMGAPFTDLQYTTARRLASLLERGWPHDYQHLMYLANPRNEWLNVGEDWVLQQAQVHLKLRGQYTWRNNTGQLWSESAQRPVSFGKKDSSDIIGISTNGKFIACECKREDEYPTPGQLEFLETIEQMGGIKIIAWPSRYAQDIDRALEEAGVPLTGQMALI